MSMFWTKTTTSNTTSSSLIKSKPTTASSSTTIIPSLHIQQFQSFVAWFRPFLSTPQWRLSQGFSSVHTASHNPTTPALFSFQINPKTGNYLLNAFLYKDHRISSYNAPTVPPCGLAMEVDSKTAAIVVGNTHNTKTFADDPLVVAAALGHYRQPPSIVVFRDESCFRTAIPLLDFTTMLCVLEPPPIG